MNNAKLFDPRIYVDVKQLSRLQKHASTIPFLGTRLSRSPMSGRYQSHFRGRGLSFEELRHYQKGDDIRQLDWKVTQRTGRPHVRSYTEEKDRQVILCIDQRSAMFFSSCHSMKSVVAAEIAALMGWIVLNQNDRVGFSIAGNQKLHWQSAKRGNAAFLAGLERLSTLNQSLDVASYDAPDVEFSQWLKALRQRNLKSAMFIIMSDFFGAESETLKQLQYLKQHNDVLSIFISDRFEFALPEDNSNGAWVIGDGEHQFTLNKREHMQTISEALTRSHNEKLDQLKSLMAAQQLPCIEVGTSGNHIVQLTKALGGVR